MDPIDISVFWNAETGLPFDDCLVCSQSLHEPAMVYYVEKIFRKPFNAEGELELLFEYAICEPCTTSLRKSLSKSSLESIEQFFKKTLLALPSLSEAEKLTKCLITRKPISHCESYSFHARFKGDRLNDSIHPYAISDEAVEAISELLSKETLDVLDDFKGRYFSGPPELAGLINPKRLLPL